MDNDIIELHFHKVDGNDFLLKCGDSTCKQELDVEHVQRIFVPKQFSREYDPNEKRLATYLGFVMYMTIIIFVAMCLLSSLSVKPFHYFWIYFNFLTMLVHIGLIVSPMPAKIHEMFVVLFPWVSLTGMSNFNFVADHLKFTVAPPYSSGFWQLGYQTKNAALNAGSLNTVILLPLAFTFLFFFFRLLKRIKRCSCFERMFMKRETIYALWIRVSL